MSCYSTPTKTEYTTVTSTSVLTSYTQSVTSIEPTLTVVQTCVTDIGASLTISYCEEIVSTIGGGESTIRVPVTSAVQFTELQATATLFGTVCSSATSLSTTSATTSTELTTSPSSSIVSTTSTSSTSSNTITSGTLSTTTTNGGTVMASQTPFTETSLSLAPASSSTISAHSTSDGSSNRPNDAAAIAGAAAGAVVALILLAFIFSRFLRKKSVRFTERAHAMGSEAQLLQQSRSPSKAASSSETIALPRMVRVSLRPTIRTQIPSPLLPITIPRPESDKPLPAIHTDLHTVRRNTSATVSGVQHVQRLDRTPTSPARTPNSASHAGEGFPVALGQSMSRRQSQHHRRSGHLSAAVELHRRSSIPFPVAGPSTVRIPESEVEMSEVPIRNIEPNRHSLPPIPVDKDTEAAADSVPGAESPPAYTV